MSLGSGIGAANQPCGLRAGSEPLATNDGAVSCCAAGGACKQQGKIQAAARRGGARIPSTSGNPREKWRSGVSAAQNRQEITRPSKRTAWNKDFRQRPCFTAHCFSLQIPADSDGEADGGRRAAQLPGRCGAWLTVLRGREPRAWSAGRNQKPFASRRRARNA